VSHIKNNLSHIKTEDLITTSELDYYTHADSPLQFLDREYSERIKPTGVR
jgi:hypothetical protein